jgi:hypothetical protein
MQLRIIDIILLSNPIVDVDAVIAVHEMRSWWTSTLQAINVKQLEFHVKLETVPKESSGMSLRL